MKLKAKWEANFLTLELLVAVFLALSLFAWSEFIDKNQFLNATFNQRSVLYSIFVSLFGTMLGFTITAAAIVLGYSTHEKLAIVRQSKHYKDLWNVFKSAMRILALATLFSLFGFIFDKDTNPINLFLYINLFLALLSFFRIARCVWVLENIINIVTKA